MSKNRGASPRTRCVLLLVWVVGVILAYFIFHKPLTSSHCQSLGLIVFQLSISAWTLSIAGGIGSLFLKRGKGVPLVRFAIQAGLGLGIFSLGIFLIGVIFTYEIWLILVVTVFLSFIFWRPILGWWKQAFTIIREYREFSTFEKLLVALILIVFFITLVNSFAPPTKFDTLVYHLTLPKHYLQQGKISYIPWLIFWGMPQIVELLFTWDMALAGPETAIILGWMIGGVAVLGLYGLVSRYYGQRAGLVSIAALLSGFTTAQSLSWGYSGWMNILLGFGFMACFLNWLMGGKKEKQSALFYTKGGERGDLVLAGVFTGLAFGVKYSSGILLLIGTLLILINKRNRTKKILDVFLYLGVSVLVLSPWLMKNIIATGNPFYPFFFPAGAMDAFRLENYQNPPSSEAWWDVLLLPFKSTILGREGAPGYGASIGPLLLALGFLGCFSRSEEPEERAAVRKISLVVVLAGLLIWGLAGLYSVYLVQTRLYFSLFPGITLLAAVGYDYLSQYKFKNIRLEKVMNGLILLVFILNVVHLSLYNLEKRSLLNIFSIESDESYLEANLGWYAPAMREVQDLPSGTKVLMLWEPRGYYCIPTCDPDEILDRWVHDLQTRETTERIIAHWLEGGYTHVLYNTKGADFIRASDPRYDREVWLALDSLWASLDDPQEIGGGYMLYELDGK